MSEDQSEDTGINVLVIEQDGQLFAVPVTSDLPMETPSLEIPGSSAIVPDDRNTLRFANFRVPGKRNRCEPCTCRTRSDFYFLDDGSAYNVDSSGTIWYQAAYSFTWEQLYRCRNYIPWSNGVSRLDHVMRDEQGFPGRWSVLSSRRIPCGRPDSGSFIGFQTDVGSCVVFYKGKIVYEGSYRSDSNGSLGISTTDDDITLSVGSSEYRNWITEECKETEDSCNVCNNNDPAGNDRELFRNTDGKWSINGSTGTWTHTDETTFVKGEITPVFSQSVTFIDPPCPTCYFGWGLGGSSSTEETGMHLGTNESGSVVWFTTKKRSDRWWRFAGMVETEDDLPDIIKQPQWAVVDEYGKPYSVEPRLRDFDVIVVGGKNTGDSSQETGEEDGGADDPLLSSDSCLLTTDFRDFKPYYLKDHQWIEHESATFSELVMSWANCCILHESTEGITHGEENGICVKKPDAWIGNAAKVQACGDVVLVNGNIKELDRLLIYQSKIIASEKAIGRNVNTCEESSKESSEDPQEEECVTLQDSVECAYSRYYWAKDFTQTELCKVADGYVFARFTQADGSVRHVLRYFNGSEWVGEWETTTSPGEPVWESGIQNPPVGWLAHHNAFWLAIGRTHSNGIYERHLFYRGEHKVYFLYPPAYYPSDWPQPRIGLLNGCGTVYECPKESGNQYAIRYIYFDGEGNSPLGCADVYDWYGNGWAISENGTPGMGVTPKVHTLPPVSYMWSEFDVNLYTGQITATRHVEVTETVRYYEVFIPALGAVRYSGGSLEIVKKVNGVAQPMLGYTAIGHHWNHGVICDSQWVPPPCSLTGQAYPLSSVDSLFNIKYGAVVQHGDAQPVGGCDAGGWYEDPPEQVGWATIVDNDLPDDYAEGLEAVSNEAGFGTTFCHLVGTANVGGAIVPTMEMCVSSSQFIEWFKSNGKTRLLSSPVRFEVSTTSYERPVWNRVFFTQSDGSNRYLPFGRLSRSSQKNVNGLRVLSDVNGYATNSLLIDTFINNNCTPFANTGWVIEGEKATTKWYALETDTEWWETTTYPHSEGFSNITKYTTHVYEIEAEPSPSGPIHYYINASVVNYYKEEIDNDPPTFSWDDQYGEMVQTHSKLTQTLWYRLCTKAIPDFWMSCGYLFELRGTNLNQYIYVSFKGKNVYTSPTVAQMEQGDDWWYDCCNEGHALVIGEVIDGVLAYHSWVEGNPAMTSSERIVILGCCATHRVINQYEYRYALLGTGDYLQEPATEGINTMQDFLDKWNKAEAEAEENEEEPEYPEVFLTDGTKIVVVAGRIETEDGAVIDHTDPDTTSLLKTTITDTRERMLFCNGAVMGSNKRYDGLYCCDEYAICVYVDDDDLSGWKSEGYDYETWTYTAEQKYTPHPGWLDKQPPAAKNRTEWDRYKSLYPGFAVDVFHQGEKVGTYRLSDANSPIYYDKRIGSWVWELLTIWYKAPWDRRGIGAVPWALEGTPKCGNGKLLIPYDGGLTTVIGTEVERRVFP